jgi:serpin B
MHWTLPTDRLPLAFDALDLQLASRSSRAVALRLAQSLWAAPRVRFEKPFLDTLSRDFGAGVRLTDFEGNAEGSRQRINAWASQATNGKIPEFIGEGGLDSSTAVAMFNAVYFRGDWSSPFDPESTEDAPFWAAGEHQVNVPTMHQRLSAAYATTASYDAVELPYEGRATAMDIVMPKTELETFEAELTSETLSALFERLSFGAVRLSMPRFRIVTLPIGLKRPLQNLGVHRLFEPEADFASMATDPLGPVRIAEVLHKAYIAVDETGTEAAATTGTGEVTAARPRLETEIRIDHPFFFVLRDLPTGSILFIGRVTDPSSDG